MSGTINPLTNDPTAAWKEISEHQTIFRIEVKTPTQPVDDSRVRFVCMSDTHSLIPQMRFEVPDGDVFLHAGDFTKCGCPEEVLEFNAWLGRLPHKHKIVIAGNHELSFDPLFTGPAGKNLVKTIPGLHMRREKMTEAVNAKNTKRLLTNATYLQDSSVQLYGINIYGTPWQPEFCRWAFNLPRGKPCLEKWKIIPSDTNILVTHTPPVGHGDHCCSGVRAGCVELLSEVQNRIKPRYHVFGHIHEGYGITSDGQTVFINASTCDVNYRPNNVPIVFDYHLPPGFSKEPIIEPQYFDVDNFVEDNLLNYLSHNGGVPNGLSNGVNGSSSSEDSPSPPSSGSSGGESGPDEAGNASH